MGSEFVNSAKLKLNFKADKKVILILGGGDGIPKGKRILRELLRVNMNAQLAIVCGKND